MYFLSEIFLKKKKEFERVELKPENLSVPMIPWTQVHGVAWVCQIRNRTCTRRTRFSGTASLPVPMRNPTNCYKNIANTKIIIVDPNSYHHYHHLLPTTHCPSPIAHCP